MRFSGHFGLNRQQPELDFVDIDPDRDMRLFIEPDALSHRDDNRPATSTADVVSL